MAFIRLLRLPNLGIVFLTQFLPYWLALRPAILKAGGIPVLTEYTFSLIAAATVLTTLAGYILNDFYDQNIDSINKPNRVVWGRYLPRSMALILYAGIVTAAHFLAFIIDHQLQPANHWPLWVFPAVSFVLFIYAWHLKCTPLIGNILVAFLCGIVPLILLLPEERPLWLAAFQMPERIAEAYTQVWTYALFGFATNLFREQIKDMEDAPGDASCKCHTLPALRGVRFAKIPTAFTGVLLLVLIGLLLHFWQSREASVYQWWAGLLLLFVPTSVATVLVAWGANQRYFAWASAMVKLLMLAGLFLLLPIELILRWIP
jgi:4-hydroxybenzoate polyprenyltransferase